MKIKADMTACVVVSNDTKPEKRTSRQNLFKKAGIEE